MIARLPHFENWPPPFGVWKDCLFVIICSDCFFFSVDRIYMRAKLKFVRALSLVCAALNELASVEKECNLLVQSSVSIDRESLQQFLPAFDVLFGTAQYRLHNL